MPWRTSAEEAEAQSRAQRRPLAVYVRAAWSPTCVELERTALASASFERATRSFVPLWIDATDEQVLAEVKGRFGVHAVPSLVLLDPQAGRRVTLTSRAELARLIDPRL